MNMWIVLIVMVPVIAILLFGKNPIREFQNEQRGMLEKYGGDDLTYATSRFVEEQEKAGFFGSESNVLQGPSSKDMISSIKKVSPNVSTGDDLTIKPIAPQSSSRGMFGGGGSTEQQQRGNYTITAPADNDFEKNLNIDDNQKYPQLYKQQQMQYDQQDQRSNPSPSSAVQSSEQNSNYYPPVFSDNAYSKPQPVQLTGKEAKLRSGQPIIFEGVYVYTVGASGERVAMPDGEYVLQDGSSVTVSGGKNRK